MTEQILHSNKWLREAGGDEMELRVLKVASGIRSEMYENGVKVMDTSSKRPYELGQACDGTIDDCVHALYQDFCRTMKINARYLYYQAYPEAQKDGSYSEEIMAQTKERANKEGVKYPIIWNKQAYLGLLESLTEINNHSLVSEIEALNLF